MPFSPAALIVWLIIGIIAGWLSGTLVTGFGRWTNLGVGLVGAIIGVLIAVVILIFGHVINLVLTAITGFMHSLRLCFVEFLFKFYEGGGTEYSPFRLKKRVAVPVTVKS